MVQKILNLSIQNHIFTDISFKKYLYQGGCRTSKTNNQNELTPDFIHWVPKQPN